MNILVMEEKRQLWDSLVKKKDKSINVRRQASHVLYLLLIQ